MNRLAVQALARVFHHAPAWRVGSWFHRIRHKQPMLAVFTFHRVTTPARSAHYYMGYNRGAYVDAFDLQVTAIRRQFETITLDRFLATITGAAPLRNDSALVTFDDADSEFTDCALPVLERHECPAVMFVPTGLIESTRRFWHLRLSSLLYHIPEASWSDIVGRPSQHPQSITAIIMGSGVTDHEVRGQLCRRLAPVLNAMPDAQIDDVLDSWEQTAGMHYMDSVRCMTWNELREASERGVAIESHAVTHRKLGLLDRAAIEGELRDSRAAIESSLGKKARAICYPAGSYNQTVLAVAAECGYDVGFTTIRGVCHPPLAGASQFSVPRLSMQGSDKYEVSCLLGATAINAGLLGRL